MVEYNIAVDSKELADNLRRWEREMPRFVQEMFARMGQQINVLVMERAKQKLNVISGDLSSRYWSADATPERLIISSSLKYSGVHEWGFRGAVAVRPHMRDGHAVRGHSRMMNIRARPYARPAIADFFMQGQAEQIANGLFEEHKRRGGFK